MAISSLVLPQISFERFIMNNLVEMFSYTFMLRSLIAGIFIALSAALVGTQLVLRRNSMLGDGLSHVAFSAFAIASVFGLAPLPVSIPLVILVSFFVLRLDQSSKLRGDSAIALMSASALAIGTFVVSLAGTNVDINSYLFGSILSVTTGEVWLTALISLFIIALYLLFHNKIFLLTFDENFAQASGINIKLYNAIFAILCSVITVLGMRIMGALLISSLLVFPTLSATILSKNFKGVLFFSATLSVVNFVIGLILSYLLATPTGATIVITNLTVFVILKLLSRLIR